MTEPGEGVLFGLAGAYEALPLPVLLLDGAGVVLAANAAWRSFLRAMGCRELELTHRCGTEVWKLGKELSDEFQHIAEVGIHRVLEGGEPKFVMDYPCLLAGRRHWLSLTCSPVWGHPNVFTLAEEDVTDVHEARLITYRLTSVVDNAFDGIVSTNRDERIVTWNLAAERLYGYTHHEAIGMPYRELVPKRLWPTYQKALASVCAHSPIRNVDMLHRAKGGDILRVQLSMMPTYDEHGHLDGCVSIVRDVSEANRMRRLGVLARKLSVIAQQDYLTGLLNRRAFSMRLDDAFRRARACREALSVLMVDMDDLKRLNDTFGHDGGDSAIRDVGDCLSAAVRRVDAVARIGGDEFAVLLPGAERSEAITIAHKILSMLQSRSSDQRPLTVSVGVAQLMPWHEGADDLLRSADDGLYRAKQSGRCRIEAA